MKALLILFALSLLACRLNSDKKLETKKEITEKATDFEDSLKIVKSNKEWKKILTDEEYYVTREKGTERAFSGRYWNSKKDGIYSCICCDLPLFKSETKFESGTGWPSFYAPFAKQNVLILNDNSLGMLRSEVICAQCDAHLGHVFNDGPKPTGLRYCINSVSLNFISN